MSQIDAWILPTRFILRVTEHPALHWIDGQYCRVLYPDPPDLHIEREPGIERSHVVTPFSLEHRLAHSAYSASVRTPTEIIQRDLVFANERRPDSLPERDGCCYKQGLFARTG